MRLAHPEFLLLLLPLAFAAWRRRHWGLLRPLRLLCLLLLVAIFCRPEWRLRADGIDLWLLVDRSASVAERMRKALPEWEALLERSRGSKDRLRIIEYAGAPVGRGQGELNESDLHETRTALALEYALGRHERDRVSRILLLTDGDSTEPLTSIVEPLVRRGIPLDYRLLPAPSGTDFRISSLEMPQRVRPGESFLIEAGIAGTADGAVEYEIVRGDRVIGAGSANVVDGAARLRFTDRLTQTGGEKYTVRLRGKDDIQPENNHTESWLEVAGNARALVITAYAQDPLAETLQRLGYTVEQITDPSRLHAGSLSSSRLVVLNNVPAHLLPQEFMASLDFFVTQQGGGLLMSGGQSSFGSGGYFASSLDPLLPVSMELKKEHRKLRIALGLALDRSGSMAATVSHGGKTIEKMQLADEGAARAIELLGEGDIVSIFAVDSEAHAVVPLSEVGPSRDKIVSAVRRIRSEGGGIFVYEGLKAMWGQVKKVEAGQRHLILFADAADAEEPGEYVKLLEEITKAGATVSVIGLGGPQDTDADLLKDIAFRGKGRVIFNSNPAELPALFAQETVAVARSAFLKDPVPLKSTPGWLQIAARPLEWTPSVDGYNLSYLRPGATAAAISGDENAAPLVAYWQRGLGRTAAVSFPVAGDFSTQVRAWPRYSEFTTTLARWLAGDDLPAGIGLRTRLDGARLSVDLFYDESAAAEVAKGTPQLALAGETAGTTRLAPWQRMAPGHFQARVDLRPGQRVRGAVQVGQQAIPFGPVYSPANAEWQPRREAQMELRALSMQTGGDERLDFTQAWKAPPLPRFTDLRPWLLWTLLAFFLLEALVTRVGGALFSWSKAREA